MSSVAKNCAVTAVGRNVDACKAWLHVQGVKARVIELDGKRFMGLRDHRLDRVNLVVENNIVTKAYVG